MKVARLQNFSGPRQQKETVAEYVTRYMNECHESIIVSLAVKYGLSIEECTAMALAMFRSIEEIMTFQFDFELPGFSIECEAKTGKDKLRIKKFRSWYNSKKLDTKISKIRASLVGVTESELKEKIFPRQIVYSGEQQAKITKQNRKYLVRSNRKEELKKSAKANRKWKKWREAYVERITVKD